MRCRRCRPLRDRRRPDLANSLSTAPDMELGLDVIEPPAVSGDNDAPLAAGMLFTVEPGIYLPGEFGFHLEDSVLLTKTGPEILRD